jgi:hypothetical protein
MPRAKVVTSSTTKDTTNIVITTNNKITEEVKPKRRGRPPIKKNNEEKQAPKKRGRKPKGGQIIKNTEINSNNIISKENIIVHLKCSTALLNKNSTSSISSLYTPKSENPNNIKNVTNTNSNSVCNINNSNINYFNLNKDPMKVNTMFENINKKEVEPTFLNKKNEDEKKKRKQESDTLDKLKELQQNLKHEHVCLTESNCFWCTCSFENPPIHIPKHIIKDVYHVYGCFCSPECATAFLFNENIDNATRFERYSLLCSLYTKIFKYDKNIKPAPNPFYTLDKFCGNLSIMEYRELFNSNRLLFVINKPITRDLPELDIVDSNIFN